MTATNNSGNCSSGGTIVITGAGGGGGGSNCAGAGTGQWITVPITTTTAAGTYSSGTITWAPGSIFDIDLILGDEKEEKSDGCFCKKCKEFFEYAEPNQEDGTLICWACRHGY